MEWQRSGAAGSADASQHKRPGFDPDIGSFCVEFARDPFDLVGFFWVLKFPPTP